MLERGSCTCVCLSEEDSTRVFSDFTLYVLADICSVSCLSSRFFKSSHYKRRLRNQENLTFEGDGCSSLNFQGTSGCLFNFLPLSPPSICLLSHQGLTSCRCEGESLRLEERVEQRLVFQVLMCHHSEGGEEHNQDMCLFVQQHTHAPTRVFSVVLPETLFISASGAA